MNVRIPETLYDRVLRMAAATKRNVPQLIELLLEEGVGRYESNGSGAVVS